MIAHINFFFSVEYRLPSGLAISARKVSKSDNNLVGVAKPVYDSIKFTVDWERCKSTVVNLQTMSACWCDVLLLANLKCDVQ